MELRIQPFAMPEAIQSNIAELKSDVAAVMEQYKGLVISEDGIDEAKAIRAKLNKAADALNGRRLDVERDFMKPFELFKKEVSEAVKMIKDASAGLDVQIKAFEEQDKALKLSDIINLYAGIFDKAKELVPLERIMDAKWLNKGTSLAVVESALKQKYTTIQVDMQSILAQPSKYHDAMVAKYLETFKLSDALAMNKQLEEQKKVLDKQNVVQTGYMATPDAINETLPVTTSTEKPREFTLRLWATKQQREQIKAFFANEGITWEAVNIKKEEK